MFHGHNAQVTKSFTRTFNAEHTKIGDIELQVDEEIIAIVTKLPLKGACWSKNKRVKKIPWSEIMFSPKCKYNYKAVPIFSFKEK